MSRPLSPIVCLLDAIRILAQAETRVKHAFAVRKLQHAEAHLIGTFDPFCPVGSVRFVDSFDHVTGDKAREMWEGLPTPGRIQ